MYSINTIVYVVTDQCYLCTDVKLISIFLICDIKQYNTLCPKA